MLGQKPGAHADTGGASKTPEWKERSAAILSTVKDLEQKVPPRARTAPRRRSVRDRPPLPPGGGRGGGRAFWDA